MKYEEDSMQEYLSDNCGPTGLKIAEYLSELESRLSLADELAGVMEHAIELGYLGEGSTANWAKETLARYKGK